MTKTYYFLGLGVLFLLFISFIGDRQPTVSPTTKPAQTPAQVEALGGQLSFIGQHSLSALLKMDNPGVLALTKELDTTYGDYLTSFRTLAVEQGWEPSSTLTPDQKRRLHQIKSIRLENFESEYLPLLITELENLRQMNAEATVDGLAPLDELRARIDDSTQRYLDIARTLSTYGAQLN